MILYIHSTKVLSDTLGLCVGYFKKGLFAFEFYPYFDLESIITTNNFVFVHLKSSCQYRFTKKRWNRKQNGVLSQNKQDTENVVHLSTFSQRIVSDDFKTVLNDYLHRNCPEVLGSMTTSGLPNGYP